MGAGAEDMSTTQQPKALRDARWYMVNKDGMATLCTDKADAEKEAADAQSVWPHMGPHRAVQLVEVGASAAELHPSPPEGMAGGWMPIETAPKNGTYLLLWEQYSTNPFVGCWAFGSWRVSHEHVDAEGGWDGAIVVDSIDQDRITHWMPLPPPLTTSAGSAKAIAAVADELVRAYADATCAIRAVQQPGTAGLVGALEDAQRAINSMKVEAETAAQGDEQMMLEACETISNEGLQADMAIRAALESHRQAPAQAAPAAVAGTSDDLVTRESSIRAIAHVAIHNSYRREREAVDMLAAAPTTQPAPQPLPASQGDALAASAAQDGGDVAMTTTQGEHAQPEALRGAPPSSYSQEDRAFYTFWYGHMLNEWMQPPLAGVSHSTARYIWDAAIAHAAAPAQAEDSVLEDAAQRTNHAD